MPTDAPTIVALYHERRGDQSEYISGCREITEAHDGEIAVPLPEMNANERNTTANILKQGLNQQAMRIASTGPDVFYPPLRPGIERHEKRSREKRQVTHGWWHHNGLRLKDRLRARWLIGYAAAPVRLRPPRTVDPYRIPVWEPWSPLGAFPAGGIGELDMEPPDCILASTRSWGWLTSSYPEVARGVLDRLPHRHRETERDDRLEVVEYNDAEETVTLVVGEARDPLRVVETDYGARGNQIYNLGHGGGNYWCAELERTPNRAGTCLVVIPGLINIGKPQGQYHGLPAMMGMQAMLWALQLHAIKRGIFTEEWVVSPQGDARVITHADPYKGTVGEIIGGSLEQVRPDPGFANVQAIDRITYWMRQEGLIPSEYGGEGAVNTRTGRRGEQVVSAVIDFPIQEAQELLAVSREAENRKAVAVAKGYARKVSFYVPTKGAKGQVTYDASDLFDTDVNHCAYAHTGVDVSRATIEGLQMVGAEAMSRRSLMELHPLIDDAEAEMDRIVGERLDRAALASIEARAVNGELPEVFVAEIREQVTSGRKELHKAIIDEQRRAQELQAQQAEAGSPETMAGLANEGMGAEQTAAAGPSPQGLEALLAKLAPPRQVA